MKTVLPICAVFLGIFLLVLSFVWGGLFPATSAWTPEKNDRLTELGSQVRGLRFSIVEGENSPQLPSGKKLPELKAKHDEVRKEFDKLQQEFESARDGPPAAAKNMRWIGIILVAAGGLFVFASREA